MIPIRPDNQLDDLVLYKFNAIQKINKILSLTKQPQKLIKTASVDNNLITLFTQMLSVLNLKINEENAKEILNNISKNAENNDINKTSSVKKIGKERKDEIKIVSKSIKDSHYQIDISKDIITKDNKKIFMVSCYARDAYLGRYLIKRNYFYTNDREEFADNSYDEIITKISALKDRYYNDIINVASITTQIKQILDGVISEIKSEEDEIGTNVSR